MSAAYCHKVALAAFTLRFEHSTPDRRNCHSKFLHDSLQFICGAIIVFNC